MSEECQRRSNNVITPHSWQLDVAECLILGLDCELIAPTGAGKTIPFVLPLFYWPEKFIIIISPLNALEEDQAQRFQQLGVEALALNGETYTSKLLKSIKNGKYRILITSPDMCLRHQAFRELLSSAAFATNICSYILDEIHCMVQWGKKFREVYSELGTLRSFVSAQVPFLLTSATLTRNDLQEIRTSLHLTSATTFHLNLGNDRPNLAWNVRFMTAGKSDLEALRFLIPDLAKEVKLQRAIIFFDDIILAMQARDCLQGRTACYHSRRGPLSKKLVMQQFSTGRLDILFATEAAGMGCDLPDIEVVVQFMVPKSLSIWYQQAGRAGRRQGSCGMAYLLVQPTPTQYVKELEVGLREWITTQECCRDVGDEYFFNPPRQENQHLKDARDAIETWRAEAWLAHFSDCPYGCEAVMPNVVVTAFASKRWETLADIDSTHVRHWIWLEDFGNEVLQILHDVDDKTTAIMMEAKRLKDNTK
ncbi:P-loop containing nucleoside triphosphate hydrolase protein [Russula brevipes]|nr:P-loop containing nucleoside triphosphate hydrolase protein [Russula brevipes]